MKHEVITDLHLMIRFVYVYNKSDEPYGKREHRRTLS